MKTKLLIHLGILFLFVSVFTACDSDDDPIPFTEYSVNSPQNWNVGYEGNVNVVMVNSDEEFEKVFTGTDYKSIDFSVYTLVVVSGTTNYGIQKKMLKDILKTSSHKYRLNVEISSTVSTIMEPWVIPVLIEKVSDKSVFEANVTIL